jgi:hypothetical protein
LSDDTVSVDNSFLISLLFFATNKFLPKLRFTAGSWISSGFPPPFKSYDGPGGTLLGENTNFQ